MKHVLMLIISVFFFSTNVFAAGAVLTPQALQDVRTTVDKVLVIVKDPQMKKDINKKRTALKKIIGERFDFEEMAKRSMSTNWQKLSKQEQKEFTALFSDLLESSYATKIENYTDEKINYLSCVPDGEYSTVKTELITKNGTKIPIEYKLINKSNKWKVYDVAIEGVSMVANYRTQFNRTIMNEGYKGLIKKMKNKKAEDSIS